MTRGYQDYTKGGEYRGGGIPLDWLDPGYYKVRSYARGPWIPIQIWMEDGERDPETWELLSDQKLRARWWPRTNNQQFYEVAPRYFFNRARPIDRSEFKWLLALKTIKR